MQVVEVGGDYAMTRALTLYDLPLIGRHLILRKATAEGGSQVSETLREYTRTRFKVDIGLYSYGGCFDPQFNTGGSVKIGRYCSFASNIRYFGGNHPMHYTSMSPYFYNKSFGYAVKDIDREALMVGHDVWCGYGVIITSHCKRIGNGVVIAAGAIVTKDVPAYAIVAGNPATILRYRFDSETIECIEQSKWWDRTPTECMKLYQYIDDPKEFCRRITNEF